MKPLKNHTNKAVEKSEQFKNLNQLEFNWIQVKEVIQLRTGEVKNKEKEGNNRLTQWESP